MNASINKMKTKLIDQLKELSMDDAVEVLPYSLLQGGCGIQKRVAYHPPPQRDLMFVFDHNGGTKH